MNGGQRPVRAFLASVRQFQIAGLQIASVSNTPRLRLQSPLINWPRTTSGRRVFRKKWKLLERCPRKNPPAKDATSQEGDIEANRLERYAAKSNQWSKFARVGKLWRDERQRTRDQAAKRGSGSSGGPVLEFLYLVCSIFLVN